MTTKYLFASIAINSFCIATVVAFPPFAPLPLALLGGTLLHLFSSTFNGFLTAKRILIVYYSVLIAAIPFFLIYVNSRPQLPGAAEMLNIVVFFFAFGIYLAIAFRVADATIGRLNRHAGNGGKIG